MRLPVALLMLAVLALPVRAAESADEGFSKDTVLDEAKAFFGAGVEGLAEVVEKTFRDQGRPNAYIKGREAGGAFAVGLRYGDGELIMKDGRHRKVHWQGPSIGFDVGGAAAKVFMLVYDLPGPQAVFQRFPGVEGSLYFVAGVGVNYLRRDDVVIAPIRAGVGWRQGASVGYLHFTREKTLNPL